MEEREPKSRVKYFINASMLRYVNPSRVVLFIVFFSRPLHPPPPCHSVYLAKDPETMQSRGFAFVSFYQKGDAEAAMKALQGYGYDHLILKLEWAKPSLVRER